MRAVIDAALVWIMCVGVWPFADPGHSAVVIISHYQPKLRRGGRNACVWRLSERGREAARALRGTR